MVDPEEILMRSKRELRAAKASVQAMREATSFEAYALAWQTFLVRLERVWVKAERECQAFRNQFQPWQGTFTRKRKNDPLLRFLHHARNVDHHSIQPTACERIIGFTLEIPPSGEVELHLDTEKQQLKFVGKCKITDLLPPAVILLSIVDSGTRYDPPTEHMGQKLTATDPLAVAEKGLAFYEDFLSQLEAKFFGART
jgi:hypothetical protein